MRPFGWSRRTSSLRNAFIGAAAALIVLAACSKTVQTSSSLENQGILGLSSTNAYLGSNLFLGQEAERSSYLFSFLKQRGGPQAIRVTQAPLEAPRVELFYPEKKEYYVAELVAGENFRQWVVRGPFGIRRADFKELSALGDEYRGEPLFQIYRRPYRFGTATPATVATPGALIPRIPLPPPPTPTPRPRPKTKTLAVKPTPVPPPQLTAPKSPQDFTPLNSDQQAILMSQGFAERAENGDVIHTVRSTKESLTAIASWYTGTTDNAEAIAKANAIDVGSALNSGMRVRVPLELLTQLRTMPSLE